MNPAHPKRRSWKRRAWPFAFAVLILVQVIAVLFPLRWVSPGREFQCGLGSSGLWFWSLSSGEFTYADRGLQQGAHMPFAWVPSWSKGTATVYAGSNPPVTLAGIQVSIPVYFFGLAAALLWMLTLVPVWQRRCRSRRGLCFACGYDLRGQPNALCPECGAAPASSVVIGGDA